MSFYTKEKEKWNNGYSWTHCLYNPVHIKNNRIMKIKSGLFCIPYWSFGCLQTTWISVGAVFNFSFGAGGYSGFASALLQYGLWGEFFRWRIEITNWMRFPFDGHHSHCPWDLLISHKMETNPKTFFVSGTIADPEMSKRGIGVSLGMPLNTQAFSTSHLCTFVHSSCEVPIGDESTNAKGGLGRKRKVQWSPVLFHLVYINFLTPSRASIHVYTQKKWRKVHEMPFKQWIFCKEIHPPPHPKLEFERREWTLTFRPVCQ